MSGGRDGGVSLLPPEEDLPPPQPAAELEPEFNERGIVDEAAAVVGVASTSSAERRDRRRSRRTSALDERPKSRRISVTEKERPVSRRVESDRPRTSGRTEERPRPRRGETEGRSSGSHRKRKEEPSGLRGLLGGLLK